MRQLNMGGSAEVRRSNDGRRKPLQFHVTDGSPFLPRYEPPRNRGGVRIPFCDFFTSQFEVDITSR